MRYLMNKWTSHVCHCLSKPLGSNIQFLIAMTNYDADISLERRIESCFYFILFHKVCRVYAFFKPLAPIEIIPPFYSLRTPIRYQNWATGDPNNGGSYRRKDEDCAVLKSNGKWNDYPCTTRFRYICKARASKLQCFCFQLTRMSGPGMRIFFYLCYSSQIFGRLTWRSILWWHLHLSATRVTHLVTPSKVR